MNYQDDLSISEYSVTNAVATVIFSHGAGANIEHDFMQRMIKLLNQRQLNVIAFNFPYMQQRLIDGKRRPPNRMPALMESFNKRIDAYNQSLPLFIGGKSMGSRVAAMVAESEKVQGVFCLGYPFHPQKKPEKTRLEPLEQNHTPVLICQGTRDALGNEAEIAGYSLYKNISVQFFADGDHDLKPRVKSGFTHQQHIENAADMIKSFIIENLS
ncbi:alpha/beta family hydrolase [Thalassotalea crassostreae]|uniref:alpha/beta family hydrolase n=1 Tax=Thalassotalea crassostreae TaxID=1763536 RepID=UPI000837D94F|nr:alpha/beta family hydrolase [Thalassotalea crassostreae]